MCLIKGTQTINFRYIYVQSVSVLKPKQGRELNPDQIISYETKM
jgi:hypothetical protein